MCILQTDNPHPYFLSHKRNPPPLWRVRRALFNKGKPSTKSTPHIGQNNNNEKQKVSGVYSPTTLASPRFSASLDYRYYYLVSVHQASLIVGPVLIVSVVGVSSRAIAIRI